MSILEIFLVGFVLVLLELSIGPKLFRVGQDAATWILDRRS